MLDVGILEVPADEHGRLTGPALAAALEGEEGVFAVVASAGTTNAGVIDDLAGVADVCGERGIWLHVDGAYGGAALAAPSARDRLAGIERADSLVVDPHKWLFANYDCAALLYRDPDQAASVHAQHADYLDTVDRQVWNPADYAVHLTRRVRGLPFWFSLAVHGTAAYRDAVEAGLTMARDVAEEIRSRPKLELVLEPDLSIVVLRRVGWGEAEYARWSAIHAMAGTWLVLPTRWQGEPVLRLCFLHPKTELRRHPPAARLPRGGAPRPPLTHPAPVLGTPPVPHDTGVYPEASDRLRSRRAMSVRKWSTRASVWGRACSWQIAVCSRRASVVTSRWRSSASSASASQPSRIEVVSSGWNCRPRLRPMRNAWGPTGLWARTVAPSGTVKRSKCHWNHGPGAMASGTAVSTSYQPNSGWGERSTVPPRAAASAWPPKHTPRTGMSARWASASRSSSRPIQLPMVAVS